MAHRPLDATFGTRPSEYNSAPASTGNSPRALLRTGTGHRPRATSNTLVADRTLGVSPELSSVPARSVAGSESWFREGAQNRSSGPARLCLASDLPKIPRKEVVERSRGAVPLDPVSRTYVGGRRSGLPVDTGVRACLADSETTQVRGLALRTAATRRRLTRSFGGRRAQKNGLGRCDGPGRSRGRQGARVGRLAS